MPSYVVFDRALSRPKILSTPAKEITFPLSEQDKKDIKILEAQFDQEVNCAGLAAPQIGIAKKITVFAAPHDPQLEKWRPDFTQTMPKTIWINPSYEGAKEDGFHEDHERCFSVHDTAALVKRYKTVRFTAYTITGERVTGTATGFLARIIQHEIDHLNGTLFIDKVPPEELMSVKAYRALHKHLPRGE